MGMTLDVRYDAAERSRCEDCCFRERQGQQQQNPIDDRWQQERIAFSICENSQWMVDWRKS